MKKTIGSLVLALVFLGMVFSFARVSAAYAASQVDINIAIDKGLEYLNDTQAADGSWGGGWYPVACTAMSVLAFENAPQEHLPYNLSDPYHTTVAKGLDYLLAHAAVAAISVQPAGNPDSDGNGKGIYVQSGRPIYEAPMALMAIVASQAPTHVATVGSANVMGRTYYDIVVDMVDWLAFAQNDVANIYRGGWRYFGNDGNSDNSNTQWPVLGLMAAELWGIEAPTWVKSELLLWLGNTQLLTGDYNSNYFYGAFVYEPYNTVLSLADSAAGILSLTYCDVPKSDQRVIAAQGFITRDWTHNDGSWRTNFGNLYAMYGIMKACRLATPTPIELIVNYTGFPKIEWYNGTSQYADWLISHQYGDGHWTASYVTSAPALDTPWGILILEYVPVKVEYDLTIRVLDDATSIPVSDAEVKVEGPETTMEMTDNSGVAFFDNLQAGTYLVTASKPGYKPKSTSTDLTSDKNIDIRLVLRAIWSSDSGGAGKDVFNQGEVVYAIGHGFNADEPVTVYVVPNGGPYTSAGSLFNAPATADVAGNLGPVNLGSYAPGKYDIWVDIDGNGLLDPVTEPVDTYGSSPGYLVVPEYWLGPVLGLAGCFAAFGVFRVSKRKRP